MDHADAQRIKKRETVSKSARMELADIHYDLVQAQLQVVALLRKPAPQEADYFAHSLEKVRGHLDAAEATRTRLLKLKDA